MKSSITAAIVRETLLAGSPLSGEGNVSVERLDLVLDVRCVSSLGLQSSPRRDGYNPHLRVMKASESRSSVPSCLPFLVSPLVAR